MRTEVIESLVEAHYATVQLEQSRVTEIREYVRLAATERQADAEVQVRSQKRRLAQLTAEKEKLLRAYYADAVPLDLMKSEQERLSREIEDAEGRIAAYQCTDSEFNAKVDELLDLAQDCHRLYRDAAGPFRRLLNQALFTRIYIDEEGEVRTELAQPFEVLLGDDLTAEAKARGRHAPVGVRKFL
jgi:hypothetical protein